MSKRRNPHVGRSQDDLLKEDGILEELQVQATEEVVAWQLEQAMKKKRVSKANPAETLHTSRTEADPSALLGDIRKLIEASRQRAALAVNAELTLLIWRIGHRIHTEVLAGQRAGYGEEILPTLATQLALDYGRGFGEKNLRRIVKFAAIFPGEPIVATVSRQLSWSHFVLRLRGRL